MPDGTGTYDLVSAHYPVLRHRDDDAAITPGGTLLFVHHDQDQEHATPHGFEVSAHVMPNDVEAHLDRDEEIEVSGTRTRPRAPWRSDQARPDIVLRAQRRDNPR